MKIKILKGEAIPTDKINTGDVVDYPSKTAIALIKLGVAEAFVAKKSEKVAIENKAEKAVKKTKKKK